MSRVRQISFLEKIKNEMMTLQKSSKRRTKVYAFMGYLSSTIIISLMAVLIFQAIPAIDVIPKTVIGVITMLSEAIKLQLRPDEKKICHQQIYNKTELTLYRIESILEELQNEQRYSAEHADIAGSGEGTYTDKDLQDLLTGFYQQLGELRLAPLVNNQLERIKSTHF